MMISEIKLQDFKWKQDESYEGFKVSDVTEIRGFFLIYKNENLRYPQVFHDSQPMSEISRITKGQTVYYKQISEIQLLAIYNNVINEICDTCQRKQNIIGNESKLVDSVNIPVSFVSIIDVKWEGPLKFSQNSLRERVGDILNTKEFVYAELYEDPNQQFIFHSDQFVSDIQELQRTLIIYKSINQSQLLEYYQNTIRNNCQDCKYRLSMPRDNVPIIAQIDSPDKLQQFSHKNLKSHLTKSKQARIQITENQDGQLTDFQNSDILTQDNSSNVQRTGKENNSSIQLIKDRLNTSNTINNKFTSIQLEEQNNSNFTEQIFGGEYSLINQIPCNIQPWQQKNPQQDSEIEYLDYCKLTESTNSRLITNYSTCSQCQQQIRSEIIRIDCGHSYHGPCFEKLLTLQSNLGKPFLHCKCNQRLSLSHLKVFNEITYAKLQDQFLRNQLATIQQNNQQVINKCSNPDCHYMYVNALKYKSSLMCPICGS